MWGLVRCHLNFSGTCACACTEITIYCLILQLEAFEGKQWYLINLHLEGKLDYLEGHQLKLLLKFGNPKICCNHL